MGYVVLQHGLMGSALPGEVFGEGHAGRHPWTGAPTHGAFILLASAALVAGWRANALIRVSDRANRRTAEDYLDVAGAIIFALDAGGVIRVANRRAQQVLGRAEAELVGRHHADVVPAPEDRDAFLRGVRRLAGAQGRRHRAPRGTVLTADGRRRLIDWQIRHAARPGRAGPEHAASGEDVTERREA